MTIEEKIKKSRKAAGITAVELGALIGLSGAAISKYENGGCKGSLEPVLIIKISDALNDTSILTHALLMNPICQRIVPRVFKPLNNIKPETSATLEKLREELAEALASVDILARNFTHKDPASQPMFRETLFAKLEQVKDVMRCGEELLEHLKTIGILSDVDLLELHLRQQAKCEAQGHHVPEMAGQ